MNLLYLFLLSLALFQFANGEILVTLVDENKSLIAQETIEFVTEEQQVLASCVTNSQGRCTITIAFAPTDASGFIRGGLLLGDRGRRPIIWPGGKINIQIMLDGGKVDVPSDLYVTRTPKPKATPTVQSELQATPTEELVTRIIQEQLVTPTVQSEQQASPTQTLVPENQLTQPEMVTSIFDEILFQVGLLVILLIALAIYVWSTYKNSNS